jgi:hypothetical protein
MKSKLSLAMLTAATLIAPLNAQAAGGTITFQGALTAPTCVVTTPNSAAAAGLYGIRVAECSKVIVGSKVYFETGLIVDNVTGMLKSGGSAEAAQVLLKNIASDLTAEYYAATGSANARTPESSVMYTVNYN